MAVAGLHTDRTARGKHARVGTGRNIPGILMPYNSLNTLNNATSCRTITTNSAHAVRWND